MANGPNATDSFALLRENEANGEKKIKEKMKNKFSHFRTMCEYYETTSIYSNVYSFVWTYYIFCDDDMMIWYDNDIVQSHI